MRLQPLLLVMTIANAAMLTINLATPRASHAEAVAPVLRARALEIVDDHGRVRATISVLPGDAAYKMPDGTVGYPETTLLRLIDQHGRPNVKVSATEQGGGVGLGGEKDPTYIHLEAKGAATALRLINRDGRDKVLTP
jgi:hypothetical protein